MKQNKILIVDDDVFSVFSLRSILENEFELGSDFAYSGQEAIQIFKSRQELERKESYRLIFMDLNMPKMNGIQTTLELKALDS